MSFEPTSITWWTRDVVDDATMESVGSGEVGLAPVRVMSWLSNMDMDMLYCVWAGMDERTCP